MNSLVMQISQTCSAGRAAPPMPVPPRWRPIVPRLQRALVAVLVIGALSLLAAFALTAVGPAPMAAAPVAQLPVVELPRVVIRGRRLPAAATARLDCGRPVSGDRCPQPTVERPRLPQ